MERGLTCDDLDRCHSPSSESCCDPPAESHMCNLLSGHGSDLLIHSRMPMTRENAGGSRWRHQPGAHHHAGVDWWNVPVTAEIAATPRAEWFNPTCAATWRSCVLRRPAQLRRSWTARTPPLRRTSCVEIRANTPERPHQRVGTTATFANIGPSSRGLLCDDCRATGRRRSTSSPPCSSAPAPPGPAPPGPGPPLVPGHTGLHGPDVPVPCP